MQKQRKETPNLAPIDLTVPGENMQWATEVAVPKQIKDFHMLLSASRRSRGPV